MKYAFLLAGFVLGVLIKGALPFEIELAGGRTDYCCLEDGTWWQSPLGFTGETRVPSFEIGARQKFGAWSVHGAFVDLGAVSANNIAVVPDADFNKPTLGAIGRFDALSSVRGILLGGAYRWKDLQAEVGQLAYRTDWQITIDCPTGCAGHVRQNYETLRFRSDVRLSSYLAISYYIDRAFITWRRFSHIDGGGNSSDGQYATGLTNGPVNQIMIGVTL